MLRGDFPAGAITPELVFDGPTAKTIQVSLGRYHPVPARGGLMPDPIVPLSFAMEITPRTKYQSLHVEIYLPHELPPGEYLGTLNLNGPGRGRRFLRADQDTLRLPVSLRVWNFSLPDHLSFLPEMNCYGLPEDELEYYRAGSPARTVLNRVPYNQAGRMAGGCAPAWDKERLKLDWSKWDRRFGPLLDGSAFADLPRKSVPVDCFYLPLHENWPSQMEGNYNGGYWADHAFPDSYRHAFVAASNEIAAHLAARQWNETLFQGFLNNKNNFKANGWSRDRPPGCWTSRPVFKTTGPFATSPGPSTKASTRRQRKTHVQPPPRRDWSSAPTSHAPSGAGTAWMGFSTIMWSAERCVIIPGSSSSASACSAKSSWNTAQPTR